MHTYTVDSESRDQAFYRIGVASAAVVTASAWSLDHYLAPLSDVASKAGRIVLPSSAFAVFLVLVALVNSRFWRNSFIRRLLGVDIPDLNGRWVGEVSSTQNKTVSVEQTTVRVRQTWKRIVLYYEWKGGESFSTACHFNLSHATGLELTYVYSTRRRATQADGGWNGVGRLKMSRDGEVDALSGDFFTSDGRRGELRLTRKKETRP